MTGESRVKGEGGVKDERRFSKICVATARSFTESHLTLTSTNRNVRCVGSCLFVSDESSDFSGRNSALGIALRRGTT